MRVALMVALACCGGSPGKLTNQQREPASFVTERQAMLVATEAGLVRIMIDGTQRETLVPARYHLETSTADGSVLVLGDSDTNLFVVGPDNRGIRRVAALDGRAGNAALRPDGGLLAVTRHGDFSRRDSPADDAIYLIDTRTLAIDIIAKSRDELVTSLRWDGDRNAVMLGMFDFDTVRLDLATRTREVVADHPELAPIYAGTSRCVQTGDALLLRGHRGDEGVDVVTSSGTRRLVIVEGRSRGFHDYLSTVSNPVFTPSCRYVVFEFGGSVWVGDVATGAIGQVIRGSAPRLLVTK